MKRYLSPNNLLQAVATLLGLLLITGCETSQTSTPSSGAREMGTEPVPTQSYRTPASVETERSGTGQQQITRVLQLSNEGIITASYAMELVSRINAGEVLPANWEQTLPAAARPIPVAQTIPVVEAVPAASVSVAVPASPMDAFANYQPEQELSGRLRSIGSDSMDKVMKYWEDAFVTFHPRITVRHEGKGSSTAAPALIEGRSDFGPMSRALKSTEIEKFESKFGYKPTQIPVAIDALAVYVHPSNPLANSGLTLEQVDAVFSSTRLRGHPDNIETWGQLGLTGEWANAPINVYSRNSASGTYGFFKDVALKKGDFKSTNQELPGSAEVVRAVEGDRYGIGYSGIGYKTPGVVTVPVAEGPGTPFVAANENNAASGAYPLARNLWMSFNLDPANGPSPLQKEFVRFMYSRQGQSLVVEDGYYPVSANTAAENVAKVMTSTTVAVPGVTSAPSQVAVKLGLPIYQPEAKLRGLLRSVGSDSMDRIMEMWEEAFLRYHNYLRVRHEGKGSSTAMPALIENRCDFGPMSRPVKDSEISKFKTKYGYEPTQFRVAADALAVYIHPSNPLVSKGISLEQLDAIFSSTRKRGYPEDIKTWGQLGLTGEWANAPINVYSRNSASGTFGFFKDVALAKGDYKSTNQELPGSEQVVNAVGGDKFGIGYSGIGYKTSSVATLPLTVDGKRFYDANKENAFGGNYPLSRFLFLTMNYDKASGLSDLQKEFLKFAYSEEGQQIVERDGYFALNSSVANKELSKVGLSL